MSENLPHNDHLENYLLGKLSAADKAAMDAKLAADSQLQEDMLLQQDIVHAIQEERRLELKNRLNNIEVGGAGTGGFSTAIGLKIAAGVALLGLFGTGLYYYFNSAPMEEETLPVGIIELPLENSAVTYTVPAMPEAAAVASEAELPIAQNNKALKQPSSQQSASSSNTVSRPAAPAVKKEAILAQEKKETVQTETRSAVVVQKPKVVTEFKDTDLGNSSPYTETPVDAMARNRQFTTKTIEVSAHEHARYDFHYQFFDNKLFIYGDFKNKPYEILEINQEGTTSYYLFFENNYYGLKSDQQKLTRLRKLNNEKLIRELEITRTQKVNTQHY